MKTACALCFVLLLAFTGCDTVTVDKPFGDRMEPSRLERFVGKWMDREANHFELRQTRSSHRSCPKTVGRSAFWKSPSLNIRGSDRRTKWTNLQASCLSFHS